MAGRKIDENDLKAIVAAKITNSVGFYGGKLAKDRQTALRYYEGDKFGNEVDGRSQVVSRDVAEAIDSMMPSLVRIFTAGDQVVQFDPTGPEDEEAAKQATDTVNWVVTQKNEAFQLFYLWFKDALLSRAGIVKTYWDTQEYRQKETYEGLTEAEYQALVEDPDAEVVEESIRPAAVPTEAPAGMGAGPVSEEEGEAPAVEAMESQPEPLHNVTLMRTNKIGMPKIVNVPPDEFLLDRRAVNIDEVGFLAHRVKKTETDLIEMGYDEDLVKSLPGYDNQDFTQERIERFKQEDELPYRNTNALDPTMREIWITECYLKVDWDNDGIAEWRKVTVAGENAYEILENEEVDDHPFAALSPVLMPHKFWGQSIADQTMDLQLIKSTLWRQMLDNMYLQNNQRVIAVEGQVNLDDLLTSRPGGVVRAKSNTAVTPIVAPPLNQSAFTMIEYIDTVREQRTGVTRYNQGLDSETLNKTATGVQLIQNASQQRLELIARVFAETGVKRLFRRVFELLQKHQTKPMTVRLRNKWVPINPSEWNARMDMTISVGLGTGDKQQQFNVLMQLLNLDQAIVKLQGGVQGPLLTAPNIHAKLEKLIEAAGYKNPAAFYSDPATIPPQPPQPSPEMMKAQGEMQLAQVKMQADAQQNAQKMQSDAQMEQMKLKSDFTIAQMKAQMDAEAAKYKAQLEANAKIEIARMEVALKASMPQDQSSNLSGGMPA